MPKIFWIDLETTGTSHYKHDIIQLAGLVDIDGVVVEEINLRIKPINMDAIDNKALEVNQKTRAEIAAYPAPQLAFNTFKTHLGKYVDPYDKQDKFVPAGYFVKFDLDFLRSYFRKMKDKYFGSWFTSVFIDVQTFVAMEVTAGRLSLPNYKLGTVCGVCQIEINAHDALSDIKATRMIYERYVHSP